MSEKSVDLNIILKKIELGELTPEEGSRYVQELGKKLESDVVKSKVVEHVESSNSANTTNQKSNEFAVEYLIKMLAQITGLSTAKIDPKLNLEEYGVDSVIIMEMNEQLEKDFKKLPKTLLFEYTNLQELAGYFVKNHLETLDQLSGNQLLKQEVMVQETKYVVEKAVEPERVTKPSSHLNFRNFHNNHPKDTNNHRSKMKNNTNRQEAPVEDIAIIGINGIFPQAKDLDVFWDNLKNGMDCITEIPSSRWDHSKYYDPVPGKRGKVYSKWGGFIDEYNQFDPLFFQLTPKDAELLDPQERVFLQCVHGAVEDAGYTRKSLWNSKTGVFVGVMYGHYQLYGAQETLKGNAMSLSSSYASIANRVSYFYNFHGPSFALDTMCSSSLTALHLACESIYRGDSETAIVGGVNLTIHPDKYLFLCGQHFASSEGKCRAFGAGGDGYVPGEGAGALVLKPLKKAEEDNDYIYGVIKGSAINHGGKTNGYTVPNPNAQTQVIRDALKKAQVNPRDISYIEAHGTGTELGDPIEITGLKNAYESYTQEKQYCAIGSVKTNVGHLESAAGVVAIIKVLLQMKYKQLVPSIHADVLNPNIDFEDTPFYVQRSLSPWKVPEIEEDGVVRNVKRCAGISSFGAGGTNVHVIIEEYDNPSVREAVQEEQLQIFAISAKDKERLKEYCIAFINYIERNTVISIPEINTEMAQNEYSLDEIKGKILQVLRDVTNMEIASFREGDTLDEFGLNNQDYVQLREKMEAVFEIELPFSMLYDGTKVETILSFIQNLMQQKKVNTTTQVSQQVDNHVSYNFRLEDLIYTVQNAREPMEERLAFCVKSIPELSEKIRLFLQKEESQSGIWYGNNKREKDVMDILSNEGNSVEFLRSLVETGKMDSLCRLWVNGLNIVWSEILLNGNGRTIPVPTYPFERRAYWYTQEEDVFQLPSNALTPVIDSNESVFEQQYYKKVLSSRDFYIREHVVNEKMVLPGVAYLEMIYQAAGLAMREECTITLQNMKWVRAIELTSELDEKEVFIALDVMEDYIEASVYSIAPSGAHIVHATCDVLYNVVLEEQEKDRILQQAMEESNQVLSRENCYETFDSIHIQYGSAFRVIEGLQYGTSYAYSKLTLQTKETKSMQDKFVLHPSIMDGAMQTALCFITHTASEQKTYVPVGVECVQIYKPIEQSCSCVVEVIENEKAEPVYHLYLFGQDEQLAVLIQGLTAMEFGQSSHSLDGK